MGQNGAASGAEGNADCIHPLRRVVGEGKQPGEHIGGCEEDDDFGLLGVRQFIQGLEEAILGRCFSRLRGGEIFPGDLRGFNVPFPFHLPGNPAGEEKFDVRPRRRLESHVEASAKAPHVFGVEIDRLPFLPGPFEQGKHADVPLFLGR